MKSQMFERLNPPHTCTHAADNKPAANHIFNFSTSSALDCRCRGNAQLNHHYYSSAVSAQLLAIKNKTKKKRDPWRATLGLNRVKREEKSR